MQTIFASTALLPGGWTNDVTVAVGPDGRIASVRDGGGGAAPTHRVPVLVPAMPNLHSHTFQRAMAGLSETRGPSPEDSFWTWRDVMYRFLDVLSPDEIEAIAAMAFVEMQEGGFGSVAEFHYLHHARGGDRYDDVAELSGRIAAAAAATGIGLTLLPVHYAQGGVDGRPLAGGQLRFGNDLDGFMRLASAARRHLADLPADTGFGLAPHSLRAVPPADLHALSEAAGDGPIHMHVAEQEKEIEEALTGLGARPVAWLLDTIGIDRRWCLIHATHMTQAETTALAQTGAVAGLCTLTEASLGDGIFAAPAYRGAGGRIGIGTDSNILISAPEELRQLETSQRLRDRRRVVLASRDASNGRTLWDAALAGGAQALGRDCGRIAPGAHADLLGLDPGFGGFSALEGDRILDALVFAGRPGMITELWSAGRHCVSGGRHVARDMVTHHYAMTLAGIMSRL